jgi:D-alanine-D-alanine ligase
MKPTPPLNPPPAAGAARASLGPVRDLEAHVPADWWNRIFGSLYLKTDGDVVDDHDITRSEVDRIVETLGLKPEDRVLDLCCGQGRHTLELARRGLKGMEGMDRSHFLIQRARRTARGEGLAVRFREGDARRLPYPADTFDHVLILGNSFGYFETLEDDLTVLKQVARVLKPSCKVLVDIADGDWLRSHYTPRSWEWIDDQLFVCRERSLSGDGGRLVSREVITHVSQGVIADQFYAERLYNAEALSALLRQAGFTDLGAPQAIGTDSKRAEDLGMMARRIVLTARIRKEWAPARRRPREAERHCVVVMGDPGKPDLIKPDTVFDADDFDTIDRMKEALRGVAGWRFSYLSDHDTLVRDLARLKGKADLVLNLCDEGYLNDPRKELHLPALLEAMGLPYTGAGPQCLAYCYDKSLVRGVAKEMGIPVPDAYLVQPEDHAFDITVDFPVLVKPNMGDSSFGITARSICHTASETADAIVGIRSRFGYDKTILVEQYLTGADLTVGIIGNPPSAYTVLPIAEEDYSALPPGLPRICGYEAKWVPDSPYAAIVSRPAVLPEATQNAIVAACVKLAERLECRDYARFDWRLDALGNPKLLEVNPNPGWCWDGHLAKMAEQAGMTYSDMLGAILKAADERLAEETATGAPVPVGAGATPNAA